VNRQIEKSDGKADRRHALLGYPHAITSAVLTQLRVVPFRRDAVRLFREFER
jgi:hypothetical protein